MRWMLLKRLYAYNHFGNILFQKIESPHNQKSTHESFVSAWFSSSGTQDVSVARRAPSNPFCPVAWYPRKPGEESCEDSGSGPRQATGRSAPCLSTVVSVALKASFQRPKRQCPAPFGAWPAGLYTKKTQRFAVLSCSGTQDWTADLMIMNPYRTEFVEIA